MKYIIISLVLIASIVIGLISRSRKCFSVVLCISTTALIATTVYLTLSTPVIHLESNTTSLPLLYFPYIDGLGEYIKLFILHVPTAWVAVLGFFLSMAYSILYLNKRESKYDIAAVAAAGLGTAFCAFTTVVGMIWAKLNWGSYWNWDPRETSILILLIIYFAYFTLRSSIEQIELRRRLSAVYSIIAAATAPFFIFVMPRIASGLHPGSSQDSSAGPVITGQTGMLNDSLLFVFAMSLAAVTLLFLLFWGYLCNYYEKKKC